MFKDGDPDYTSLNKALAINTNDVDEAHVYMVANKITSEYICGKNALLEERMRNFFF